MERTQCISETSSMMTDIQFMYSEIEKYRTKNEILTKELESRWTEIKGLEEEIRRLNSCIRKCYNASADDSKKLTKADLTFALERIHTYVKEVL